MHVTASLLCVYCLFIKSTSSFLSGTLHPHLLFASRFSLGALRNADKNVKKCHSLTRNRLTRFYKQYAEHYLLGFKNFPLFKRGALKTVYPF